MNVSKIVESALKQLGVLAAGEHANADEVADAVDCLKALLAQWATERLYLYKIQDIEIMLQGTGIYTLNQTIQDVLETASLDDEKIQMRRDLEQSSNDKNTAKVIYSEDTPYWTFRVVDNAKSLNVKACVLPTSLEAQDQLYIPDKYERPLILSLALEIAPMFGVEPSMLLIKNQSSAIDLLKRSNSTPYYVQNDLPVGVRHACY
ncbi:hypothetical protein [Acinetobacter sp. Marseille-Q1618]|uniref:hypothetical protein n=1 Tax=Acinetobacter sp. Marseille-Q1618 TaxID=2697502 RepID=UPI00156F0267|nr:hypothetical protein [Acinetobacter sp. Marseille-Q1618]